MKVNENVLAKRGKLFYNWAMNRASKILCLSLFVSIILTGCAKNSPTELPPPDQGTITFVNASQYALRLTRLVQTHNGQVRTRQLNVPVYLNGRYQLHNIFTDDVIFPGGDLVTIGFVSMAHDPGNPNLPLFSDDIYFSVNGSTIVKVNGAGDYEVSGR